MINVLLAHKVEHQFRNPKTNKNIEQQVLKFVENQKSVNKKLIFDKIKIPIIFHVIYNNGSEFNIYDIYKIKVNRDILDKNIISQLNKDYNNLNEDINNTPEIWRKRIGNFNIDFYIKDVIYVNSSKDWDLDNEYNNMKFSKYGGSDVIDPELNLNIWLVSLKKRANSNGVIMGYSQFPEDYNIMRDTDGYVHNIWAFPQLYNDTRTATHEIGHWVGLRHIWGDGGCDEDDGIVDTPLSSESHIECDGDCEYPKTSSCNGPDMFMNYMSYGEQVNMFTKDQVVRGRSFFEKGGVRYSIVTQNKNDAPEEVDLNVYYIIYYIILAFFICLVLIICFLLRKCIKYIVVKKDLKNMNNENVEDNNDKNKEESKIDVIIEEDIEGQDNEGKIDIIIK